MLLSYVELRKLVNAGVVKNCPLSLINGTSIDITLGRTILVEQNEPRVVSLRDKDQLSFVTVDLRDEGYILQPGEFILAQSEQMFFLPLDISAEYKLKSSMARMGLEHLGAGWCDPGWNGSVLTMEFVNLSRYHRIRIRPGDKIGQMCFFQSYPVPEEHSYKVKGRYNQLQEVSGARPDQHDCGVAGCEGDH